MHILIVNGPNLNLLGVREVGVYGSSSYHDLVHTIQNYANLHQINVTFFQSNHEGAILDFLHENYTKADALIINPGAFTHYSYAIYDCLKAINLPAIEVHLSKIDEREPFRAHSVIQSACLKQISGLGFQSYLEAIDYLRSEHQ